MHEKTIIVMPAYNAERTLERVFHQIPEGCYDEIIVVDDHSQDNTVGVAGRLPVTVIRHDENMGYGGNQKTCYRAAMDAGATHVVMLHPDYQYDARVIPLAVEILRLEICDVIVGNRIRTRKETLSGGMPLLKYLSNRGLSLIQGVPGVKHVLDVQLSTRPVVPAKETLPEGEEGQEGDAEPLTILDQKVVRVPADTLLCSLDHEITSAGLEELEAELEEEDGEGAGTE